jgi:hypothetical protein
MDVNFKDMSADAFERLARRQVERAFEGLPDDARELPYIGGWPFIHCERVEQKQLAVAALCCTRWFELEAPPWAQPLPLTAEACRELFNGPHQTNRRSRLRGEYGLHARELDWVVERMTPFEVFCSQLLSPT